MKILLRASRMTVRIHFIILSVAGLAFAPAAFSQTITTPAGTVVWTLSGNGTAAGFISEVTLNRNGTTHSDGLDGAMRVAVTGSNVSFTNNYYLSSLYAAAVQHIAVTNNGSSATTFTISLTGNLGSDAATRQHYSSLSYANGAYFVSSDQTSATMNGSDPVISMIFAGKGHSLPFEMAWTSADGYNCVVQNIPIAAGQTRRFLVILGVGNITNNISNSPDQANLVVQQLLTGELPKDFTSFLSPAQKLEVMNWGPLTVLPVTWQDFTANASGRAVRLDWSTASEINAKEFVVEHSIDGQTWSEAGSVLASGNSNQVNEYRFIHDRAQEGVNFYRLRQVDIDERFSYSKVVKATLEITAANWRLNQNPVVNGRVEIQLKEKSLVNLYNSAGALIVTKNMEAGYQQIDVTGQVKGIYFLRINGHTEKVHIR